MYVRNFHLYQDIRRVHTTLQRSRDLIAELIWNLEEKSLAPNCAFCKASLVQIRHSVHLTLGTENFIASQALLAVSAGVVLVTPAYAVAFLKIFDVWSSGCDDSHAFVAENEVGW